MHIPFETFRKYDLWCERYIPNTIYFEYDKQIEVTYIMKLVYGYYENGKVFDNTYYLKDKQVSDKPNTTPYANWLWMYMQLLRPYLQRIKTIKTYDDYELMLYDLCEYELNNNFDIGNLRKLESIYDRYRHIPQTIPKKVFKHT